ncbi:hypothetical protein SB768_16615 [Burkholderia sp. SIMBA_043]|uniref:hypothetical protein n=2 Tax=Burkholderiaceae TaxID=119060 RepID=UPI001185FE7F|nr:hypothetical protein [Burkholderia vietnamiensis]MBR8283382.1 hypothetical protein [Burkholderia vietnamiensis]UBI28193.1 hypothetical protein LA325_28660 [Burkholderia vietnamiensis]
MLYSDDRYRPSDSIFEVAAMDFRIWNGIRFFLKLRWKAACALVLGIWYSCANRIKRKTLPHGDVQVIVSLTTFHKRINTAFLTLESLFAQRGVQYEVHLHLANSDMLKIGGRLPAAIERLRRRGLKVFFHEENLKSYKKLYYTIIQGYDVPIVTADDDILYPNKWLKNLLDASKDNPGCIVCYRGHDLNLDRTGTVDSYKRIYERGPVSGAEPNYSLMPTGCSGVLYPPASLARELMDPTLFMELAPTSDDIWFKLCSLVSDVRCVRVSPRNVEFLSTPDTQRHALFIENVDGGQNDKQMRACFERYPEALRHIRACRARDN